MIPRLLWPLLTPVRSAPSCGGGYPSRDGPHRSPRVPHVSFPPSTRHIYSTHFRVVIGLRLVQQSCPCVKPQMCFLYVGPEVCPRVSIFPESSFLQIPPHGGHPCFRLYPSHYRADSGLSPVRNVRRRAHNTKIRRMRVLDENGMRRISCTANIRCAPFDAYRMLQDVHLFRIRPPVPDLRLCQYGSIRRPCQGSALPPI